jgi:DNA-directed RNA polymerase II subunit RPB1
MTNKIKCGAKGSNLNVSQMTAVLGQQVIEGKRVVYGFQNRTLPHFKRFDDSARARGFMTSSFVGGLEPDEFFFHAISGREGMIDTSLKTADSGYMQRKLIKGMEDVMMTYDKTVRSGNNVLMQVIYGENGINQTHYKSVELKLVNMGNKEIENLFCFSTDERKQMCAEFKFDPTDFNKWNKNLATYMENLRDDLRRIQMKARTNYITMQSAYQLPVNMNRIVEDAKNLAFNNKLIKTMKIKFYINWINY